MASCSPAGSSACSCCRILPASRGSLSALSPLLSLSGGRNSAATRCSTLASSGKLHLHLLEHSPDDQQQRRVGGRLPALALPPVHQEFFSWDCGTHPYRPAARPDHSLTCGREDLRPGGTTDRRDHRHGNHHARALFFPSSLARIHLFS